MQVNAVPDRFRTTQDRPTEWWSGTLPPLRGRTTPKPSFQTTKTEDQVQTLTMPDGLSPAAQVIYHAVRFTGDLTLGLAEQALQRQGYSARGDMGLHVHAWPNVWMWTGVNADFIAWMKELTEPDHLYFAFSNLLVYGYDGSRIPDMPIIRPNDLPEPGQGLKEPSWLPVILRFGPNPELVPEENLPPQAVPHALYRFFGSDGSLLYIGLTMNPGTRWPAHSKDKPWWLEVHTVTSEHFPDRPTVEEAERTAIRAERPRHNVIHNRPKRTPARTTDSR